MAWRNRLNKSDLCLMWIERYASTPYNVLIVGTKTDLYYARQITFEQGQVVCFMFFVFILKSLAAEYGLPFIETSSKESIHIKEATIALLTQIIKTRG